MITRGSLISFNYARSLAMSPNMIHDPRPMVIITDIWPNYIRGVNLHYLTFPYIKRILQMYGGNGMFSYSNIKPDPYVANAFRMYVRAGVQRPKRLDTEWLLGVLAESRSFSPGEIEKIRTNIEQQIQARLQAKANELTSYEEWRRSLAPTQQRQLLNKIDQVQKAFTGFTPSDSIAGQPSLGVAPTSSQGSLPSNPPPTGDMGSAPVNGE